MGQTTASPRLRAGRPTLCRPARPRRHSVCTASKLQNAGGPCLRRPRCLRAGEEECMGIIAWIIVGLIAGWLAGMIMKGGGYGLIGDLILGLIGAVVGG